MMLVSTSVQAIEYSKGPPEKISGTVAHFFLQTDLVRPYKPDPIDREIVVYTPPGYSSAAMAGVRYPVIYLLHGAPGNPWNFVRLGHWPEIMEKAQLSVLPILVIPDGNYAGAKYGDSEWVNSFDGRDMFENFVVHQVVPWTDSHFRTIPDAQHRVLGGVSEGGYGAANVGMHHPDVFGGILALSGYYVNDGSGWARPSMGHEQDYLDTNSPATYVQKTLSSGSRNPWAGLHIFVGAGADEKRYTEQTDAFAGALARSGIAVNEKLDTGKHGWELWDTLFRQGLRWLLGANQGTAS
jgi:enterochelin esterase-like enzyme